MHVFFPHHGGDGGQGIHDLGFGSGIVILHPGGEAFIFAMCKGWLRYPKLWYWIEFTNDRSTLKNRLISVKSNIIEKTT